MCLSGVLMVVTVCIALIWPAVANDSINRFAPMAEAFAAGNWLEAFHPRFGVIFQVISGMLVWLTGIPGNTACSIVGVVSWSLCIIPLFGLAKHCFGERAAWLGVIIYIIMPTPFYWALRGMREPMRLLGTLLMLWGVFRVFARQRYSLLLAVVGSTILCSLRVDTILPAAFLVVAYQEADRMGWRTCVLMFWSVIALQPCCYLTWVWTGYWVPVFRIVALLQRLGVVE